MARATASISLPDRYRVVRHIANGGMASVWEAHDEALNRAVAVKVLAGHLSEDDNARRRFQREARTAAGLSSHAHVATIYDVGEYEGKSYIVMELLPGGSVADRVKSGREIDDDTALRWLRETGSALDAAHEAGIVHRDVKPANMLLDDRGRLALGDFGIARLGLEDQITQTGQVLGTAAYISPEQAMGEPATPASDRYALAVVAFELLTGRKPFRPRTSPPRRAPTSRTSRPSPRPSTTRCRRPSTACWRAAWPRSPGTGGRAPPPSCRRSTTRSTSRRRADPRPPRHGRAAGPDRPAAPARARAAPRRWPWPGRRRARRARRRRAADRGRGAAALAQRDDDDPGTRAAEATQTPEATTEPEKTAQPEKTTSPSRRTPSRPPSRPRRPSPPPSRRRRPRRPATEAAPAMGTAAAAAWATTRRRSSSRPTTATRPATPPAPSRSRRRRSERCEGSTEVSPCAYALFEYARALRGTGNPQAAVEALEERLQRFPDDQRAAVEQELDEARAEAGGG